MSDAFEKQLKRLEEIVEKLEEGGTSLEQSLKLYEEGVKLTKECSTKLEDVQQRIEMLVKDQHGTIRAKVFNDKEK